VDNRNSDFTGCFRIEVKSDTAELSDMRIAGLNDEILNREMFIHIKQGCVQNEWY